MRKMMMENDHEGKTFIFDKKSYNEIHGVTLCCIVLNEEKDLADFIAHHKPYVKEIIMIDGGSTDSTMDIAMDKVDILKKIEFSGHYANQKNRAVEQCQTDWVLFVDADERVCEKALKGLDSLINQNEFDCYAFARENFVDDVFDKVNYPDLQLRLFRSYCRFVRPVHEELVGFQKRCDLPEDMFILHKKGSKRHISRNGTYHTFLTKYSNELGAPGKQSKDIFIARYGEYLNEVEL